MSETPTPEPVEPDALSDVVNADPANADADADRPEAPDRPLTLDEQRERAREALQGGDTGTNDPA
jgi:hypothetical protein